MNTYNRNFTTIDVVNLEAINSLEILGNDKPTEDLINKMEKVLIDFYERYAKHRQKNSMQLIPIIN